MKIQLPPASANGTTTCAMGPGTMAPAYVVAAPAGKRCAPADRPASTGAGQRAHVPYAHMTTRPVTARSVLVQCSKPRPRIAWRSALGTALEKGRVRAARNHENVAQRPGPAALG